MQLLHQRALILRTSLRTGGDGVEDGRRRLNSCIREPPRSNQTATALRTATTQLLHQRSNQTATALRTDCDDATLASETATALRTAMIQLLHQRAFVYEGFRMDKECNHLISRVKSELKRSAVANNESGKSKLSEVRTSSEMFIAKGKF